MNTLLTRNQLSGGAARIVLRTMRTGGSACHAHIPAIGMYACTRTSICNLLPGAPRRMRAPDDRTGRLGHEKWAPGAVFTRRSRVRQAMIAPECESISLSITADARRRDGVSRGAPVVTVEGCSGYLTCRSPRPSHALSFRYTSPPAHWAPAADARTAADMASGAGQACKSKTFLTLSATGGDPAVQSSMLKQMPMLDFLRR